MLISLFFLYLVGHITVFLYKKSKLLLLNINRFKENNIIKIILYSFCKILFYYKAIAVLVISA